MELTGGNLRVLESNIIGKDQEPVVHICYHDALAYANGVERGYQLKQNGNGQLEVD